MSGDSRGSRGYQLTRQEETTPKLIHLGRNEASFNGSRRPVLMKKSRIFRTLSVMKVGVCFECDRTLQGGGGGSVKCPYRARKTCVVVCEDAHVESLSMARRYRQVSPSVSRACFPDGTEQLGANRGCCRINTPLFPPGATS